MVVRVPVLSYQPALSCAWRKVSESKGVGVVYLLLNLCCGLMICSAFQSSGHTIKKAVDSRYNVEPSP